MKFCERVKSKSFWEEVRTNPAYQFMIDELLGMYEQYGQGEIKDISYDAFMVYHRTGSRQEFQSDYYFPRRHRLNACALLSLIYPDNEEYFDNLMNTIWAICNEYCWALPNHVKNSDVEYNTTFIDLFAAETGFALSEIRYLLGDRMSKLMNERIHQEVERRIIQSFKDNSFWWEKSVNNWAAVCGGSVGCTFMYERPDLFYEVKPRIDAAMESFLASYKADGVCREGLSYWQYGFGFFIGYAQRLLEFSEGKINLFEDDHVKTIAQFPTMTFLDKGATISFADGPRQGVVGLGTTSILKSHYGDLISLIPGESYVTRDHCARWDLHINSIVWFDPGMDFNALPQDAVYYMKESEWFVKKCEAYGFAAKGGNNAEPHNHNDLGSFILCHGGHQVLTDLGAGEYNRDYFGEKRYTILCNRSAGHSVPIVDGYEQCEGEEYAAKTEYDGEKLTIDITEAYPKNRVSGIVREFSFTENSVILKDAFTFAEGCEVKERLVALAKPEVTDGCIQLEEVRVLFDPLAWAVNVSEEIHVKHALERETVYLIDFTARQLEGEFKAEFVVG